MYACAYTILYIWIYDFIQLFQLYSSWSTITTMLHSDKKQGLGVVGFREHWAVIWVRNGRDPTHLTLKQFGMVETSVDRSWPPMDCSDHWKGLPVFQSIPVPGYASQQPQHHSHGGFWGVVQARHTLAVFLGLKGASRDLETVQKYAESTDIAE